MRQPTVPIPSNRDGRPASRVRIIGALATVAVAVAVAVAALTLMLHRPTSHAAVAAPVHQRPDALAQATPAPVLGSHEVEFAGRVVEIGLAGAPDRPVAGARVMAYAPPPGDCGNGAISDAEGRYVVRCNGLAAGRGAVRLVMEWSVYVADAFAELDAHTTSVVAADDLGKRHVRDIAIPAAGPIPSPTAADSTDGLVDGRVVAARTGFPVAGARVHVQPDGCNRQSLSDRGTGAFAIRCVLSTISCLKIAVDAPGFAPFEDQFCGSGTSPLNDLGDNVVVSLSPAAQTMPTVVDAEADTWVEYDVGTGVPVADDAHGHEPLLSVGMWDTGVDMDMLVRFGPPPAGLAEHFDRAELWLSVQSAESISHVRDGSRKAASLAFRPALDAWDEATVNGKSRPRHGATDATVVTSAGLLKLDFTAPARAWLEGQRQHGWTVRGGSLAEGGTIGVSVWLASRETAYGPKLVLFAKDTNSVDPTATPSATPTAPLTPRPSATTTGVATPATWRSTAHLPWAGRGAALRGPD